MTIIELIKLIPENSTLTFTNKKDCMSIEYSYVGEKLGEPGTGKGHVVTNDCIRSAEPRIFEIILDDTIKDLLKSERITWFPILKGSSIREQEGNI